MSVDINGLGLDSFRSLTPAQKIEVLGINSLYDRALDAEERVSQLELETEGLQIVHSNQLSNQFEARSVRISSQILRSVLRTVLEFPQVVPYLQKQGQDVNSVSSISVDLIIPPELYGKSPEQKDELKPRRAAFLEHSLNTAAQLQTSPTLVRSIAQMLTDGYEFKFPPQFDPTQFADMEAKCNRLLRVCLKTLLQVNPHTNRLGATEELFNSPSTQELRNYSPEVLASAFTEAEKYIYGVGSLIYGVTQEFVKDAAVNPLVVIQNRVALYKFALGVDDFGWSEG